MLCRKVPTHRPRDALTSHQGKQRQLCLCRFCGHGKHSATAQRPHKFVAPLSVFVTERGIFRSRRKSLWAMSSAQKAIATAGIPHIFVVPLSVLLKKKSRCCAFSVLGQAQFSMGRILSIESNWYTAHIHRKFVVPPSVFVTETQAVAVLAPCQAQNSLWATSAA